MNTKAPKPKILYIAGFERSGSTLVHNALGQIDGYLATGEPRYYWDNGLLHGAHCGCGRLVADCPQWKTILKRTEEQVGLIDAHQMVALRRRSRWLTPLFLLPGGKTIVKRLITPYCEITRAFYQAIIDVTGGRMIIDSSKSPLYTLLLSTIDNFELYVVHLVRDPRGVEYSLQKRKDGNHPNYQQHTVIRGALSWMAWNGLIEWIWGRQHERYMRVRYEDFVLHPRTLLQELLTFAKEEPQPISFVRGKEIDIQPTCSVGGSPSRFKTGWISLEADVEWHDKLDHTTRRILETVTAPLLSHYGYSTIEHDSTSHNDSTSVRGTVN